MNNGVPPIALVIDRDQDWFAAHPQLGHRWRLRVPREFGLLEAEANRLDIAISLLVPRGDGFVRAGLGDGLLVTSAFLQDGLPHIEKLVSEPDLFFSRWLRLRQLTRREVVDRCRRTVNRVAM